MPISRPAPDTQPGIEPYVQLPDPQQAALVTEIQRHDQALYMYGEFAFIVMMWHAKDAEANDVPSCSRCYAGGGEIAETYKQASDSKCPVCFGTRFEPGYRARVVRPIIIGINTDDDVRPTPRGEETPSSVSIQTTGDIRPRHGDYIFRGDGTRWSIDNPVLSPLHTGFNMVTASNSVTGYLNATARQESVASPAFIIPPTPQDVVEILNVNLPRTSRDFSEFEDTPGPLIV